MNWASIDGLIRSHLPSAAEFTKDIAIYESVCKKYIYLKGDDKRSEKIKVMHFK